MEVWSELGCSVWVEGGVSLAMGKVCSGERMSFGWSISVWLWKDTEGLEGY